MNNFVHKGESKKASKLEFEQIINFAEKLFSKIKIDKRLLQL